MLDGHLRHTSTEIACEIKRYIERIWNMFS